MTYKVECPCEKCSERKSTRLVVDYPDCLPLIEFKDGYLPPDQTTRRFLCAKCDHGKHDETFLLARRSKS